MAGRYNLRVYRWIAGRTETVPRDRRWAGGYSAACGGGPARHHQQRIAGNHHRLADAAGRLQRDLAPLHIDRGHHDPGAHRVADAHRGAEFQVLADIDAAGPRQARAEHGGDEARRQHAMGDAALEHGALGEFMVHMDRVAVARDAGKENHIGLGHGLGVGRRHAGLEILEVIAVFLFHDEDRSRVAGESEYLRCNAI